MGTDLRTAAKQALEALEIGYDSASAEAAQYHAAMAGYRPHRHAQMDADVQKIAQAITALRAALAEDALQRLTDVHQEIEAALEQPEQEPVDAEAALRFALAQRDWAFKQLQAQPDRREWRGLTQKEITGMTCECVDDGTFNMQCAFDFARAIEAALKERNA
jgi:hypothetical protein